MRCAPRALNGPNHLGLCALQVKLFKASMIIHLSKQWQAGSAEGNVAVAAHRPTFMLVNTCRHHTVQLRQQRQSKQTPAFTALCAAPFVGVPLGWDDPDTGAKVEIQCTATR